MTKTILTSTIVSAILLTVSGCAHKTECGIDKCGKAYTDTTYRSYPKQTTCSNQCSTNTITLAKPTCTPCQTSANTFVQQKVVQPVAPQVTQAVLPAVSDAPMLRKARPLKITVHGQGVSPVNTVSPAQAYALAKRAAVADAYRLIAEKVKGVYVEGEDLVQNMMVKRSTVRTSVQAMVRNANVTETNFKDGLCEVEMEINLSHADFAQ